jgi:hypothetical protein
MRKLTYAVLAIFLVAACEKDKNSDTFRSETVSMGSNSTMDVYFSMSGGEISSIERADWDIAFSVPLQSATILINEGAGVELYSVGDTNFWASVDENTINQVEQRFNNKSDWSTGAFNVNATGFPNYGWGTYHFNTDHNVGGDSLYVIRISDGTFKKFMVRVKLGTNSSNIFRWADLNGDNEVTETFTTSPYFDKKHFIHYSLVNQEIVEAEPDMNTWDLLFTRYVIQIPTGPSSVMNYPVMGVLSNPDARVARVTGIVPEEVTSTSIPEEFSEASDVIGHDWKISDPITHEISLADSTGYFVESVDGSTYFMYFTEYGGNTAGTISFKVKNLE